MNIVLYNNTSEKNHLNKHITTIATLEGTLRSDSSIINPRILVEGNSFTNCNYAYIPSFNRYYYVTDITSFRTGIWLLSMESDPLMSFKNSILQLNVVLMESETTAVDKYLLDDRVWTTKVKHKTDIVQFPSGLSADGEFILITSGG